MVPDKNYRKGVQITMGSIVSAECKDCSLSDKLFLGGGMINFDRFCNFPFACHDCYSLICINIFEIDCICPNCESNDVTRYDHPFLLPRELGHNAENNIPVFSWSKPLNNKTEEILIHRGKHKCAICLEHSLVFRRIGSFD